MSYRVYFILWIVIISTNLSLYTEKQLDHFVHGAAILIETTPIPWATYKDIVTTMPICCVDLFIYNPATDCYLEVLRKDEPAKDLYWFVGGRIYKGESFFDAARRKAHEEVGLEITPCAITGVYSTTFSCSAWNTSTHTINIGIYAQLTDTTQAYLIDSHHKTIRWQPRNIQPDNAYLAHVYHDAYHYLAPAG